MSEDGDNDLSTNASDPGLARLAEQITQRVLAGGEVLPEDYLAKYPQWAESLQGLLPAMRVLSDLGRIINGFPPK